MPIYGWLIFATLIGLGFAQTALPSVSKTWKNSNNTEHAINVTGSVDFQYLVGIVELQIEIRSGNGTIEFGLGHQNASIELHALSAAPFYISLSTALCMFPGIHYPVGFDQFYVQFETSTMLELNTTNVMTISPTWTALLQRSLVFYIAPPRDESDRADEKVTLLIESDVPLDTFLSTAQVEGSSGCIPQKDYLINDTVPAGSSNWTIVSHLGLHEVFSAYNYTLYFTPAKNIHRVSPLRITLGISKIPSRPFPTTIVLIVFGCVMVVGIVGLLTGLKIRRNRAKYTTLQ